MHLRLVPDFLKSKARLKSMHAVGIGVLLFGIGLTSAHAALGTSAFQSSVGLTAFSYFNPVLMNRASGLAAVRAQYRTESLPGENASPWAYSMEVHSIASSYFSRSERSIWMELAELNVGLVQPRWSLTAGRKRFLWSELDQTWGLGLWQPRLRWDYLEVGQVALTGFFWNFKPTSQVEIMVYGSPLFIPERGPEVALREGVLYPSNGWPGSPPTRVPLNGIDTDVRYTIEMPSLSKLLLNPAAGAQVRWGAKAGETGSWVSTSYAYKPINQPVLAFDGYFDLAQGNADAVIHPRISYHELAQVEAGQRWSRTSLWASALREVVHESPVNSSWTTQTLSDSWSVGAGGSWAPLSGSRLDFSIMRRWGNPDFDRGPQATPGASVFEPRSLFNQAASATWTSRVPGLLSQRLSVRARMIHELGSSGTLLGAQLQYRPFGGWSFTLGADVLGADPNRVVSSNDFIARYRAHDRIYGGLSYVF